METPKLKLQIISPDQMVEYEIVTNWFYRHNWTFMEILIARWVSFKVNRRYKHYAYEKHLQLSKVIRDTLLEKLKNIHSEAQKAPKNEKAWGSFSKN